MTDNTLRFSGRAEDYDRFRQRYPAREILERLTRWCGLTAEWFVADIGAGTGMLAEVFLAHGNRVCAVEPNPEMRAACARLLGPWPRLQVIDATAETTALTAGSIDLVAAGRAFHWFDRDRALVEFRRIARPGGWLALMSLGRANAPEDAAMHAQAQAFDRLLVEHGTDYAYVRSGYRVHDTLRELFPDHADFQQECLHGTQELDWEAFRGQVMSLSVVPQPDHAKYEAFQQALRSFFDAHAVGGVLTQATDCWITVARLSAALNTR